MGNDLSSDLTRSRSSLISIRLMVEERTCTGFDTEAFDKKLCQAGIQEILILFHSFPRLNLT